MYRIPQSILFAMIAFNITAFAVLTQLEILGESASLTKVVAWMLTVSAWVLTYKRRSKYFVLF